jgi:NAD(P)-dependent dehydrogenase (short-subunit alcohol dehydrogenase family)
MDLSLEGKVALVTGTGSQIGFGKCIALTLAKEGCDIIGTDKDMEGANQTAAEVRALKRQTIALKADVTNIVEMNGMVKAALAKFGKIDILVNNAGGASAAKPFVDKTEEDWDFDRNLNVRGVFNCTKAVLPHMIERRTGKIINISSGAGKAGLPYHSTYSAAKGAVITFTKALALEVIDYGINVNCIAPNIGDTNFLVHSKINREFFKQAVEITPAKRATTPQDVANAVAFLASNVSSYILGQALSIDGGVVRF